MRHYFESTHVAADGVGGAVSEPMLQAHFDYQTAPCFIRIVYIVAGEYVGFDILDDLNIPNGFHSQLINAVKFNSNLLRKSPLISPELMIANVNTGPYNIPLLNAPAVPFNMDIYVYSLKKDAIQDVNIAETFYTDLEDIRVPVRSISDLSTNNLQVYNHKS